MSNILNMHWDVDTSLYPDATTDKRKALFVLDRMLPEYVWDITHLEGNPYSFVEVQTLLQGTTISGHALFDQTQILNQAKSIDVLKSVLQDDTLNIDKKLLLRYHRYIARDEALKWGVFRDGEVGISGTDYIPPTVKELDMLFSAGLSKILTIKHPFECALAYYFFGSSGQFFYDGNKRTSRLAMNTILMQNGYYYLSVPGGRQTEFDHIMVDFYNTSDATKGFLFFMDCYKHHD